MKILFLILYFTISLKNNEVEFSFDLYEKMIETNLYTNLMFSPYSLRVALSMLLEGKSILDLILQKGAIMNQLTKYRKPAYYLQMQKID